MGLEGSNADLDWSILSLLFSLATRPLDTTLTPPFASAAIPDPKKPQADPAPCVSRPKYLWKRHNASDGSISDGSDAWDEVSELSDWSEAAAAGDADPVSPMQCNNEDQAAKNGVDCVEETAVEETAVRQAPDEDVDAPLAAPAAPPAAKALGGSALAQLAQRIASPSLAKERAALASDDATALSIGPPRRRAAHLPGDLLPCLGRTRQGLGAPCEAPLGGIYVDPRWTDCRSDPDLVHQTLSILLGSRPSGGSAQTSSAGDGIGSGGREAYAWDERMGRPVPRRGLHVPYLSPTQLHSLLDRFAESGGRMYRLRAISDLSSSDEVLNLPVGLLSGVRAGAVRRVPLKRTVRAFLTAMRAQLDRISRPMISLQ